MVLMQDIAGLVLVAPAIITFSSKPKAQSDPGHGRECSTRYGNISKQRITEHLHGIKQRLPACTLATTVDVAVTPKYDSVMLKLPVLAHKPHHDRARQVVACCSQQKGSASSMVPLLEVQDNVQL